MLLVSVAINKDKFLEDKLACELDHTSHRVIKNFEHLACTKEVDAPHETRLRCKLNSENSCFLMLIDFLAVEKGDETVQDLIAALKAIGRHDVVKIITDVYPGMFNHCASDVLVQLALSDHQDQDRLVLTYIVYDFSAL